MKRANEDISGGGSKKQAADGSGGSGGGAAATLSEKTQPIERPFRLSTIHLTFNQCTWEEVGAGELKYLPLSQTPYYMMGPEHLNLFNKYKNLWTTMRIHQPKARISNLIMLQDDLINQGGTPLETTAFTQVCYMLQYHPKKQTQFFRLANLRGCNEKIGWDSLSYNLSGTECDRKDIKQLIEINGFQDFEHLAILTAKVDKYAGYAPYATIQINPDFTQIKNTYIPPNDRTIGALANYAANLQPDEREGYITVDSFKQVTWARNTGSFKLLKVNDTSEIPITTNITDLPLINDIHNDFTNRTINIEDSASGNLYTYNTEFCWPSNNRPYYTRKDNLNQIRPYETNKMLSPINHTFFCMPPIRKANGALLKQRCSFMLEQEFSITLEFSEGVWDDGENATSKYLLNQNDGIVLRPNIYGTTQVQPDAEGAYCGDEYQYVCTGDKCPIADTYKALTESMGAFQTISENLIEFTNTAPSNVVEYKQGGLTAYFDWLAESQQTAFKNKFNEFKNNAAGGNDTIFSLRPVGTGEYITSIVFQGFGQTYEFKNPNSLKYLLIKPDAYLNMLDNLGIVCTKKPTVMHANYVPVTRNSQIFYM